ncbi:MAG: hypothetical protein WC628_08445 [Candidatus Omnitrophota bacterium]
MRNINFSLLLIVLISTLTKASEGAEYASPAWMDNETIICVKYVDTVKDRLFGWFGDITDARSIVVRQEIQIVSMDIEGKNEKVIKSIVIDYPGQSPKWREEVFKGVRFIRFISYSPNYNIIAFGCDGAVHPIFIIKDSMTKKIVEEGFKPRFSPDGKFLQYTSSDDKIWFYDFDVGENKILIENARGGPWSPDGKKIAISKKIGHDINGYLYDLETKEEEFFGFVVDWAPNGKLIKGSRLLLNPRVSPDGTKIVGEPHSDPIRENGRMNYIGICDIDEKNLKVLRYYAKDK